MEMDRAGVRSIPGAAEADPVRTVDALPGVTRVSEIGASFNVRGGSADQNLVLLDGVPIFNPFHMLGIFSVFNADMVKRTQLRSGGFAAEYGGRASSVLLVESDLGDGKFGVDAGLSLLTARLAVSGGLPEEARDGFGLAAARWRISGRRSYADVLANPFLSADFPYHLGDRQFGFEAWTRGGSRLGITYYSGTDALNLTAWERLERSTWDPELHPEQDVTWRWGNRALGFSWTRPGSNGGSLDVHGSYSRFEGDFNLSEFGSPMLETAIRRVSLGADLELRPTSTFRWQSGLGLEYLQHSDISRGEVESLVRNGRSSGLGASAYSQFNWSPNPRWLMEGGLRLDHWFDSGTSTSPRIALKRFLWDGRWAVRLDAGRYVQFLQSVRDESLPIALDSWVLAGNEVSPLVSRQFQGGLEGFFGTDDEWFASAVGFHRGYEGLAARNWADDPGVRSDDFRSGTGRSFGAEFLLRRNRGATTGWGSVSLLKATREFPDQGHAGIDNIVPGVEYPPAFDRRLALDLVVQRRLPWSVEGGLRWSLGTGLPFTRHATYSVNPRRMIDLRPGGRETVVWLGPRNGERYPVHHRLDISLRKVIRKRWGVVTPWLNVLNVYNRRNVVFYEYDDYFGQPGIGRPGRRGVSLVPILPTSEWRCRSDARIEGIPSTSSLGDPGAAAAARRLLPGLDRSPRTGARDRERDGGSYRRSDGLDRPEHRRPGLPRPRLRRRPGPGSVGAHRRPVVRAVVAARGAARYAGRVPPGRRYRGGDLLRRLGPVRPFRTARGAVAAGRPARRTAAVRDQHDTRPLHAITTIP